MKPKIYADYCIAHRQGDCVAVSIPAQTDNDWRNKNRWLDLPLMNQEDFHCFVEAVKQIEKEVFE